MTESLQYSELNPHTDLSIAADLIELCFARFLDRDGCSYIEFMRKTAQKYADTPGFLLPFVSLPSIPGVVCKNSDSEVVGNINYYPETYNGNPAYMISNVCVHPDYRHQGIARRMLEMVLDITKRNNVSVVLLLSRESTHDSNQLYLDSGFEINAVRNDWIRKPVTPLPEVNSEYRISAVPRRGQEELDLHFARAYPSAVTWHLMYNSLLFKAGFTGRIGRRLSYPDSDLVRISNSNGITVCWACLQKTGFYADSLWFIPSPDCSEQEAADSLCLLANEYGRSNPLSVSYESGKFEEAFGKAGFERKNVLLWMKKEM